MSQDNHLSHYGILGQKWGIRRFQNEDGSLTEAGKARYGVGKNKDWKRLKKDAEADAKEYAMAKAFYGEGAGNRRKRIKNQISERMKDPDYKAEFEKQLAAQDMEKVQQKADRERHAKDAVNTVSKTARGVKNFLLGNAVPVTTAALAIGALVKVTGADQKIMKWGKIALNTAIKRAKQGSSIAGSTGMVWANIKQALGKVPKKLTVDELLKNMRVEGMDR